MPRYIDAEMALKIIDSYAKTVSAEGKVVVDAIRDIIAVIAPTADVVPKSEVERLESEVAILNEKNAGLALACFCDCMANEDCLGHNEWKAIKAEVAREIFEEIKKLLDNYHSAYLPVGEITPYACYEYGLGDALAELKKKYTEVKE